MIAAFMLAVPFILGEAYVSRKTLPQDRPGRPGLIPVAAACVSYAGVSCQLTNDGQADGIFYLPSRPGRIGAADRSMSSTRVEQQLSLTPRSLEGLSQSEKGSPVMLAKLFVA